MCRTDRLERAGAPRPSALSANVFQICPVLEFLNSTWAGGVDLAEGCYWLGCGVFPVFVSVFGGIPLLGPGPARSFRRVSDLDHGSDSNMGCVYYCSTYYKAVRVGGGG